MAKHPRCGGFSGGGTRVHAPPPASCMPWCRPTLRRRLAKLSTSPPCLSCSRGCRAGPMHPPAATWLTERGGDGVKPGQTRQKPLPFPLLGRLVLQCHGGGSRFPAWQVVGSHCTAVLPSLSPPQCHAKTDCHGHLCLTCLAPPQPASIQLPPSCLSHIALGPARGREPLRTNVRQARKRSSTGQGTGEQCGIPCKEDIQPSPSPGTGLLSCAVQSVPPQAAPELGSSSQAWLFSESAGPWHKCPCQGLDQALPLCRLPGSLLSPPPIVWSRGRSHCPRQSV